MTGVLPPEGGNFQPFICPAMHDERPGKSFSLPDAVAESTEPEEPMMILPETRAFADVEQWHVQVSDGGADGAPPLAFNMLVFTPKGAKGPLPILIAQNFCGNRALFKRRPPEIAPSLTKLYPGCESGKMDWLIESILGKYISGPPIEKVLARGYALAEFYAGDVAADSAEAELALQRLSGGRSPRTGGSGSPIEARPVTPGPARSTPGRWWSATGCGTCCAGPSPTSCAPTGWTGSGRWSS